MSGQPPVPDFRTLDESLAHWAHHRPDALALSLIHI